MFLRSGIVACIVLAPACGTDDSAPDPPRLADAGESCELRDPCFDEFVAARATAETCFGHADTCRASSGADPRGCGTKISPGSEDCGWPDGARLLFDSSTTPLTLRYVNATGIGCAVSEGLARFVYPDGRVFTIDISLEQQSLTIQCPSGTSTTWVDGPTTSGCVSLGEPVRNCCLDGSACEGT